MTNAEIDRLAEFCDLKNKGYARHGEGWWILTDRYYWSPDVSDDDCRILLEAFAAKATERQKQRFDDVLLGRELLPYGAIMIGELVEVLLKRPETKCKAVLAALEEQEE